MEGCGLSCIKYILFVFNFLFAIAGIGIIAAGSVVLADGDFSISENDGRGPAIALVVLGAVIFVTAFFGCCGAFKENYCMLITFAVILILIFIAQLAIGITAAVYKDRVKEDLKGELDNSLQRYKEGDKQTMQAWSEVQEFLGCCGVNGPGDFIPFPPASCCPREKGQEKEDLSLQTCQEDKVVYKDGCYNKLGDAIRDSLIIIMGVGIGIAFVELGGAVLACVLANNIRKESNEEA